MSKSKQRDAELILKLYDLRREETMRKARDWMIRFNPESMQDITDAVMGEHSAYFRQVTSYWEMAASLVNHGAIDEEMFNDANAEHILAFSKIQPFVEQIRAMGNKNFASHLEQVVMRLPEAEARLERFREMSKQMTAARAEQAEAEAANA
jgi:hypothetical protein